MDKTEQAYMAFLDIVTSDNRRHVDEIHELMMVNGCKVQVKPARAGYVVSYISSKDKKTIFNYIFRKNGLQIRIYANHVNQYPEYLQELPEQMIKLMDKASPCKRLLDPTACNSRCMMGYDFMIGEKHYQKCRNNAFQFPVNDTNSSFIMGVLERELAG